MSCTDEYFLFRNKKYKYFDHPHNKTRINERTVEVPISMDFVSKYGTNLLEVGCVTPYYFDINHTVIDLADGHRLASVQDATTVDYSGKNVLSISTIEHVGLNDYDIKIKEKESAINLCKKIFTESLNYFLTWPLGYNKILDDWAFNETNAYFISRCNNDKYLWKEKTLTELSEEDKKYGSFKNANSILVLSNI
jgi:hypothetical protein